MALQFISTIIGRGALAQSGVGNVTLAQIGISENFSSVDENSTLVASELKKIPISGQNIDGNHIHFAFMDESEDEYAAKTIGVFLEDGTLFAIHSQNTAIFEKSTASLLHFSFDIGIIDLSDESFNFPNSTFANPAATTSLPGIIEIATDAEANAGIDATRAITPSTLKKYIDAQIAAGIDAALLNGKNGAYYENIPARLGFTPLHPSAMTGVWTNLNDGIDSGMNADLLDDHDASDFILKNEIPALLTENGHVKIPVAGGTLILQWVIGVEQVGIESAQTVYFPLVFPNSCLFAGAFTHAATATYQSNVWYQTISWNEDSVQVMRQIAAGSGPYDVTTTKPMIFAIGF